MEETVISEHWTAVVPFAPPSSLERDDIAAKCPAAAGFIAADNSRSPALFV